VIRFSVQAHTTADGSTRGNFSFRHLLPGGDLLGPGARRRDVSSGLGRIDFEVEYRGAAKRYPVERGGYLIRGQADPAGELARQARRPGFQGAGRRGTGMR
jgi:hypothetical protein